MSVIVDAFVAGAAAGGKDVATAAVKDAYAQLKSLLVGRLSAWPQANTALAEVEGNSTKTSDEELEDAGGSWRAVLEAELVESGAASDADVLAVAHELLALLRSDGVPTGAATTVDAHRAQGLQIGNHNTQTNTFGAR